MATLRKANQTNPHQMQHPSSSSKLRSSLAVSSPALSAKVRSLISSRKACHDEQFTNNKLATGNLPCRDLIPLLDNAYTPDSELPYQIMNPTPPSESPSSPPTSTWSYFTFSPTSLAALKSLATQSMTLSSGYISTDDAISSFIWRSVTHAHLPRLNSTSNSTFTRAVDIRRYLDISPMYPGLFQNMTYHSFSLWKLVNGPLGWVASHLRAAVDPKTSSLKYNTRTLATFLHQSNIYAP